MPHPNLPRRQSGFTLIEIAIVLVIIGLLLGGILKGQELITQGRIRNVANDFQSMTAAINLYQDRYRALPGDDPGAQHAGRPQAARQRAAMATVLLACTVETPLTIPAQPADESRLFWHHLRLAGLVGGATTTGDIGTAQSTQCGIRRDRRAKRRVWHSMGPSICSNNLPAKIAQAIDTQFDDGNRHHRHSTRRRLALQRRTAVPRANYVDDGANFYVVCKAP